MHVPLPQTGDQPHHDGDVTSQGEHVANFSGKSRDRRQKMFPQRWPTKMATTASGTTNVTPSHKQLLVATQFSTTTTWSSCRCLKVGIPALQTDETTTLPPDFAPIPENHLPTASQPPPSHQRILSTPLIKKIIGFVLPPTISAPYRPRNLKQKPTAPTPAARKLFKPYHLNGSSHQLPVFTTSYHRHHLAADNQVPCSFIIFLGF